MSSLVLPGLGQSPVHSRLGLVTQSTFEYVIYCQALAVINFQQTASGLGSRGTGLRPSGPSLGGRAQDPKGRGDSRSREAGFTQL